jgi:hypothetical protein
VLQGFNRADPPLPAAQWFDRLYTKRNHDGIAVNAAACRSRALIANYMMKATLLPNPPPAGIAGSDYRLQPAFSSANEARSSALKTCSG